VSPSALQSPGWQAYSSPKWGYSIQYPQSWRSLPNFGAPDTEKYFSNENVGSPMSLDLDGIWLTITVSGFQGDQCLNRGRWNLRIDRQVPLTVDGSTSSLNALKHDGYAALMLNVQRNTYCYSFTYLFKANDVRDATQQTTEVMLGQTFHFGQPSAPAPT
jgi:hypothetical protein